MRVTKNESNPFTTTSNLAASTDYQNAILSLESLEDKSSSAFNHKHSTAILNQDYLCQGEGIKLIIPGNKTANKKEG